MGQKKTSEFYHVGIFINFSRIRATIMIFVMIVAYIIFWTPYHVFKWIEAFGSDLTKAQCMRFKNIMQLYVFSVIITLLTSLQALSVTQRSQPRHLLLSVVWISRKTAETLEKTQRMHDLPQFHFLSKLWKFTRQQ